MTDNIDWDAPAIAPEEGKRYVLRNGEVTGVIENKKNFVSYPFIATVDSLVASWDKNGYVLGRENKHHLDIIAELKTNDGTKHDKRIQEALDIAMGYGGIAGDHHKAWVIDQMVRALTGCVSGTKVTKYVYGVKYEAPAESDEYREFVRAACDGDDGDDGDDGPDTYSWDIGVAP